MDRHLNLVFQGGGIRGMAYAGVLSSMPDHCKISCVWGTSAGSIVAALLATGVKPKDLQRRLEKPGWLTLLTQNDAERTERLNEAWCNIQRLWIEKSGNLSAWNLWCFRRQHKKIFEDLRTIWDKQGLYGSGNIRSWLDKELEGKTY